VIAGAEALAAREYQTVQQEMHVFSVLGQADYVHTSELWGLSQDEVFRAVMGRDAVTFIIAPQCANIGCPNPA